MNDGDLCTVERCGRPLASRPRGLCNMHLLWVNGKGGFTRFMPVDEPVHDALVAYLAVRPATTGPLLRWDTAEKRLLPKTISVMLATVFTTAGIKHAAYDNRGAHALRRTAASEVYEATKDIRATQDLLGHKHLASTEHYLRRSGIDGLRAALGARADKFAAADLRHRPELHIVDQADTA